MASLRPWIIVAGASCLALALAYVPPRGAKSSGRPPIFFQTPRGTPARQHAQALAEEWRGVERSLQLLNARHQLHDMVRAASSRGNSLIVVGDTGGLMSAAPQIADSAAHVAWRQLGLGETKIGVVLVIRWASLTPPRDRPPLEEGIAGYLPPDSTDRTTCLAVVTAGRYWTRDLLSNTRGRRLFAPFVQSLKAVLGPCAFYAAFGTPGAPVRSWLAARRWELASTLDPGPRGRSNSIIGMAEPRYSWYWDAIYSLPPTAVGCLARRSASCRAAVLAGASDAPSVRLPDIVQIDRRWGRVPRLVEAGRYLGDVAHAVGRDRFLTFWTSPQPVDTALATALKRPVGEWTAEWLADFARPIRLGPAPPLGGVALACAIALLAIAIVVGTASRRQVR
ncbi:MAG TPA: hypothetical protein VGJ80_14630 [Gemmatimonadales bacterium]